MWVKSSLSAANGNCVEVSRDPAGQVLVRDSKNPDGLVLVFSREVWEAFLSGVRNGEFG
jgi:hypothetical protein